MNKIISKLHLNITDLTQKISSNTQVIKVTKPILILSTKIYRAIMWRIISHLSQRMLRIKIFVVVPCILIIFSIILQENIVFCAGPHPVDITMAKDSLETDNPIIAEAVLRELATANLSDEQLRDIDNTLNAHIERHNPDSRFRVNHGQIHNTGNVPNTVEGTWDRNTLINVGLFAAIGVATIYLIYRNWEYLGSFFRSTAETAIIRDPAFQYNLARRFARMSTNPDLVREVYVILRRH